MADEINTGNVIRSVPNSPVVENVRIKLFLHKTPIPSVEKVTSKWVQGAPTPIQEGQLTPLSEALNLLVGFSSGKVIMEGEELKHIPSISESLDSIWVTPKRKNTDGCANRTKKAKIAQKEPFTSISKQLAIQKPQTKIPDSEIQIENIIQDSPSFVPYKVEIPKDKVRGKGVKNVKMNIMGSDLGMAQTKKTDSLTKNCMSGEGGEGHKSCPTKTSSDTIRGKGPSKAASH